MTHNILQETICGTFFKRISVVVFLHLESPTSSPNIPLPRFYGESRRRYSSSGRQPASAAAAGGCIARISYVDYISEY